MKVVSISSMENKKVTFIITPIDNVDFRSKSILDQDLLEEEVLEIINNIEVFDLQKQSIITTSPDSLKDHHWFFKNDKFYKVLNVI